MTPGLEPLFAVSHHLDDLQRMVQESFAGFFLREVPVSRVRAADAAGGFDAELWATFVALGGQAASLPSEAGGAGGSLTEAALIGMECGRRLAPIPYAGSLSATRFLARDVGGSVDLDVARGVADIRDQASVGGGVIVSCGAAPELLVVRDDRVEVYERSNPTLLVTPLDNLGALPLAMLDLSAARPDHSIEVDEPGLARWLCEHRLLAAAVLIGAGQQALSLCIQHVKERRQFGRSIGSFQAVQHRLADRVTDVASAQLLVLKGASALDQPDDAHRHRSAVALAAATRSAESAAKEALQLFGGYGYTLEYDIHLYLRFIKAYGVVVRDRDLAEDSLPARVADAGVRS